MAHRGKSTVLPSSTWEGIVFSLANHCHFDFLEKRLYILEGQLVEEFSENHFPKDSGGYFSFSRAGDCHVFAERLFNFFKIPVGLAVYQGGDSYFFSFAGERRTDDDYLSCLIFPNGGDDQSKATHCCSAQLISTVDTEVNAEPSFFQFLMDSIFCAKNKLLFSEVFAKQQLKIVGGIFRSLLPEVGHCGEGALASIFLKHVCAAARAKPVAFGLSRAHTFPFYFSSSCWGGAVETVWVCGHPDQPAFEAGAFQMASTLPTPSLSSAVTARSSSPIFEDVGTPLQDENDYWVPGEASIPKVQVEKIIRVCGKAPQVISPLVASDENNLVNLMGLIDEFVPSTSPLPTGSQLEAAALSSDCMGIPAPQAQVPSTHHQEDEIEACRLVISRAFDLCGRVTKAQAKRLAALDALGGKIGCFEAALNTLGALSQTYSKKISELVADFETQVGLAKQKLDAFHQQTGEDLTALREDMDAKLSAGGKGDWLMCGKALQKLLDKFLKADFSQPVCFRCLNAKLQNEIGKSSHDQLFSSTNLPKNIPASVRHVMSGESEVPPESVDTSSGLVAWAKQCKKKLGAVAPTQQPSNPTERKRCRPKKVTSRKPVTTPPLQVVASSSSGRVEAAGSSKPAVGASPPRKKSRPQAIKDFGSWPAKRAKSGD
jgi:hypothetical protein